MLWYTKITLYEGTYQNILNYMCLSVALGEGAGRIPSGYGQAHLAIKGGPAIQTGRSATASFSLRDL